MLGWLFTHVMAAAGAGYGWLNPFFGLMVYYTFAILRPPWLWFWKFDPATAPRFSLYIGVSILFGWLFAGLGKWHGLKGSRLAIFGLLLYLGSGFMSWQLFAVWPGRAENAWIDQAKIILMAIVTLTIVRDARSIRIFVWVVIASLGYLAKTLNDWYFMNSMYLHNNGFGSIDNNGVGMIMVMTVPLCFFMAVSDKRIWVRLLCFFATACAVHVILFSYSRGSQLGLIVVGFVIFVFAMVALPRKILTLACVTIMVVITLRLAGEGVRERFMSIFAEDLDASADSRYTTWAAGWACMLDHPLGVGPRNFHAYGPQYGLGGFKSIHNLYLQTGADYGFIGLFGLVLFYLATLFKCTIMTFSAAAKKLVWPRYLGLAVTTSLSGFLFCSIFIGMESVEVGYIISLLGLSTVAYVNRVNAVGVVPDVTSIPELWEVRHKVQPVPGFDPVTPDIPPLGG